MKPDALAVAVIIFFVGVLLSSTGLIKAFITDPKPPTALEQAVTEQTARR